MDFIYAMLLLHFNSIKVRLELTLTILPNVSGVEFQFHKGAIRTQNIIKMGYDNQLFQFHKGAIRTKAKI